MPRDLHQDLKTKRHESAPVGRVTQVLSGEARGVAVPGGLQGEVPGDGLTEMCTNLSPFPLSLQVTVTVLLNIIYLAG